MILLRSLVIVFALAAGLGPAQADEISDGIASARKLYEAGRLSKAVNELNYAAGQIGKRLANAYLATLPPAPSSWRALPSKARSGAGLALTAGQMINRTYRQEGGRGRIKAELVVDNPMLQAMAGIFANPAMAMNMGYERVSLSGVDDKAFLKWNDSRSSGEIVLVMAGRVFIKLSGRNLESPDVLKAMMAAWDIKKLKEIAELK